MNKIFDGPIAGELSGFLQFKRSLGYGYGRAEFTLREFDQFLFGCARKDPTWQLDRAAIAWLSSKPQRSGKGPVKHGRIRPTVISLSAIPSYRLTQLCAATKSR